MRTVKRDESCGTRATMLTNVVAQMADETGAGGVQLSGTSLFTSPIKYIHFNFLLEEQNTKCSGKVVKKQWQISFFQILLFTH